MQVYFIQVGDDGPIKIGKANDTKKRLSGLQVAHPMELKVLHLEELIDEKTAIKKEKEYHKLFAPFKIRGEWFYPHLDILTYLDKAPLTWEKMIALDSEIELLYHSACTAVYDREDYQWACPRDHIWYRHYKQIMQYLVGFLRPEGQIEVLRSCEAYDLAYRKICDAIPCPEDCANKGKC